MVFLKLFFISIVVLSVLFGAFWLFSAALSFFMDKWKILNKKQAAPARLPFDTIANQSDMYELLCTVIQNKIRVSITLNNRGPSFISLINALQPPTLLIEKLFPEEGNELIAHSRFITVGFTLKEPLTIPYTFDSFYVQNEICNGRHAFRISVPHNIKRDQKRNYHRVEPSVHKPLYITFQIDHSEITEKIANISGGGVAFYTNFGKSRLWAGRKIKLVSVSIPGIPVINCMAVIYTISKSEYPVFIDGKPYHYVCGAEFVQVDGVIREKIIQYVIESERAELKRLHREFE